MANSPLNGSAPSKETPATPLTQEASVPMTPLTDWRELRLNGRVDTFRCSGRTVRWKPVNLARALRAGKVPDNLTAYVAKRAWSGADDKDERDDLTKTIEWVDYLDWIAQAALVYPTLADTPAEQNILPDDLYDQELQELELWATYPLAAVRPFPGQQNTDVDARHESRTVEPAAE
jgi:hypothetical protein